MTPEENEAIQRVSKLTQLGVRVAHMCASAYGARGDVIYVSCRGKPTRRDDVDAPERRHVATADALTKEGIC